MEEHDIGWAVQKMREGFKVFRNPEPQYYLFINPEEPDEVYMANGSPLDMMGIGHILAKDWEVVVQ